MAAETFWLTATDHARLYTYTWLPAEAPRAVVLLAHGMAEHAGRYGHLGEALATAGIALYAPDLRGHGRTAEAGVVGHYADRCGWSRVLDDLAELARHLHQVHPGTPMVVMGHSMGSYLAQGYLLRHGSGVQGAIFSGSNYQPPGFYRAARLVARLESLRQGAKGRSALIERLSFGTFNKAFRPTRTRFDWLNRDPAAVDAYINDPLCGFRCTNQLWLDLLQGLALISAPGNLAQVNQRLPILIVGGSCDPVSQGKRLTDLAHAWGATGSRPVTLKLYAQARHEILNEINREEVIADLLAWLQQALATQCPARSEQPPLPNPIRNSHP
ncbi:alpha/beta hydrolase [Pseudomonas sp. RIT-To-2]|uniref:alpha/beta hydrolase n=1 Tax=Pseudomonas sp. RIT-To-2 TaxID=3462541 RepID=UPI00241308A2